MNTISGVPEATALDRPDDAPLRIAVIVASVRKDRVGPAVADWAAGRVAAASTGHEATLDVIDLASVELPDDGLLEPGGGPRSVIAQRLDEADGFVLVTPEYNHSYPASLKRAVDWHYGEWMFKAAMVLPYGVHGGLLASEHLRGVLAELHVVTTRRVVGLASPWHDLGPEGYSPSAGTQKALDHALAELMWWTSVLRTARRDRPFAL